MSLPKKYEKIELNLTIESAFASLQQTIVRDITYSEPEKDVILIQGETASKQKISLLFRKQP